uniref:Uncharacterized protein n=1 Tax=Molossus molossus TaxID=27622 RepID=A0A7J8HBH8_MOLMO|nr:hypothetical protein HJG59_011091 [Molossus molossus]
MTAVVSPSTEGGWTPSAGPPSTRSRRCGGTPWPGTKPRPPAEWPAPQLLLQPGPRLPPTGLGGPLPCLGVRTWTAELKHLLGPPSSSARSAHPPSSAGSALGCPGPQDFLPLPADAGPAQGASGREGGREEAPPTPSHLSTLPASRTWVGPGPLRPGEEGPLAAFLAGDWNTFPRGKN